MLATRNSIMAFVRLGNAQRGLPEQRMLDVQMATGGSVLNYVVEHVGDLTHRMTHMVKWVQPGEEPSADQLGHEYVVKKVRSCLNTLQSGYGFERELLENLRNNAEYRKEDTRHFQQRIFALLSLYGNAHARLVVYNKAQMWARDAAVALGRQNWEGCVHDLRMLNALVEDREEYQVEASKFSTTKSGKLKPYKGY